MGILCTFPGRYGDLLWALPTIRAIAEAHNEPVDLQIGGEFAGIVPLLEAQPYLTVVVADPRWDLGQWQAPSPPSKVDYAHIYHLGYRRWPELPLPYETLYTATQIVQTPVLPAPDLTRPWITVQPDSAYSRPYTVGFTEAYFEMKYGIFELVTTRLEALGYYGISVCTGGRWQTEAQHVGCPWHEAAEWIAAAPFFLGDCSALHVLAVALGVPVICCEPMEARWNPLFYPLGSSGPGVTLVTGNDGKPTFDARHVGDALLARLT